MNTIKNTLKKANRFDNILQILVSITRNQQNSYTVNPFVNENGKLSYHVKGSVVEYEAAELLDLLLADNVSEITMRFENLSRYVRNQSDMLLHNYTVSLSHKATPDTDLETIRCWEILQNLLDNIDYIDDWSIPKGWQA